MATTLARSGAPALGLHWHSRFERCGFFYALLARYCVFVLVSWFYAVGFLVVEAFAGVLPSLAACPGGQSALQLLCGTFGCEAVEMDALDLALTVCMLIQHHLLGTSLDSL